MVKKYQNSIEKFLRECLLCIYISIDPLLSVSKINEDSLEKLIDDPILAILS